MEKNPQHQLDVPSVRGHCLPQVRVVVGAVGAGVVLLRVDYPFFRAGVARRAGEPPLDVGDHVVQQRFFVAFLGHLDVGHHAAGRPVATVSLGSLLLREGVQSDFPVEIGVVARAAPRPGDSAKKHRLHDMTLVLHSPGRGWLVDPHVPV